MDERYAFGYLIYRLMPRLGNCLRLLVVLVTFLIVAHVGGYLDRRALIPNSTIRLMDGNEYVVPHVAELFARSRIAALFYPREGDSDDAPKMSTLELFEDGRALGAPHALHIDIVKQGLGRYSHWANQLQFSSSDNSDPRTNGRVYSIVEQPATWRLLVVPSFLIVLLLAGRQRAGLTQDLPELNFAIRIFKSDSLWFSLTGVLAVYVISYYIVGTPPVPLIAPDSSTYWFNSKIIPVGYPIFLSTIYGLFGSLRAIVVVQITLFAVAVITVQFGIRRVTESAMVAGISAIVLLVVGNTASTAIWLLTESIVTSAILFHVAAAAFVLKRPTQLNLTLLALTAVFAISIRPAAYFLLGGIIFLALFWHGHRRTVIRTAGPALCVFMLVYYGVGEAARGQASQSITGLALFPHIAHLYDGTLTGAPADVQALIDTPALRSYKIARSNAPNWQERQKLEVINFNRILQEMLKSFPLDKLSQGEIEAILQRTNEALTPVCLYLIAHHPTGYLAVVGENLGAWITKEMFAVPPYVDGALSELYSDFWNRIKNFYKNNLNRPTGVTLSDVQNGYLLTGKSEAFPAFALPLQVRELVKIAFLTIAVFRIIGFIAGYAGPTAGFAAYVGALAFGGALVVAMSTVFIDRYSIPLEPLVLIVVTTGGWRAFAWIAGMCLSWSPSARRGARR